MNRTSTSKQFFAQLNLIYFAQVGTMLIFAAVTFTLIYAGKVVTDIDPGLTDIYTYSLIGLVVLGFTSAHFLYHFQLSRIDKNIDLKKKTPRYLGALMIRSACMELPALYATVVFFLTGNYNLLFIPLFTAVVFYLLRPTPSSIAEDMKLSENEKSMLNNPETIVAER